jgi:hypothetical protein
MTLTLGRFGDRRLEKGGPSFWAGWLQPVAAGSVFAVWAVIAPVRSG